MSILVRMFADRFDKLSSNDNMLARGLITRTASLLPLTSKSPANAIIIITSHKLSLDRSNLISRVRAAAFTQVSAISRYR
jgi:hypothetical protein